MTPEQILNEAIEAVTGRMENHGSPRETFADIAARWTATIGVPVTAHQVALCLIDLKIVRANNNPQHIDNAVDIAGYASLLGQLIQPAAGQEKVEEKDTVLLVCDFLRQGLAKKGDVLIDNNGNTDVYFEHRPSLYYPNESVEATWSGAGWKFLNLEGKQTAIHIVRIERDGVVVAERQRYYDCEQPKNEPPLPPSTLHPASPPREPQAHYLQKPSSGQIWRHKEGGLYKIINVEKSSLGLEYVHYSPVAGNEVYIRHMAQIMKDFRKVEK